MVSPMYVVLLGLTLLSYENRRAAAAEISLHLQLGNTHPVSDLLYGIFFEEINHAGEGGLYGELIQDRSFDALAITQGITPDNNEETSASLTRDHQAASTLPDAELGKLANHMLLTEAQGSHHQKHSSLGQNQLNQPISWRLLNSTKATLTKADPISKWNAVAMKLTSDDVNGGIVNTGFWGIAINGGWIYHFSMYIKGNEDAKVRVLFAAQDSDAVYAEVSFEGIKSSWQKFSANITSNTTDFNGKLVIQLAEPGTITIDSVSLFPGGSMREGWQNPYPFREDLLQHLKDLNPRFVRFPGGCYVEGGDWLRNRFPWKSNLGLNEHRSGHLNDVWGYWSTDGLGLFEYMLLAEELNAEPVYVVNNGISHAESTPLGRIAPFLKETLDAVEFITGPATSHWGSQRAAMGRTEPWKLNFLAIGNEDCGHPWYIENYNAFYIALKGLYPHITLIANCNLNGAGVTELWDWHSYDASSVMFNRMHEFDGMQRGVDPAVFVSEYAVTVDGGLGNLKAAVAEASFMTGMERNSDIVKMASYAPLFVNTNSRSWSPDMIVFDGHRSHQTPSYLVQALFSRYQGKLSVQTLAQSDGDANVQVAASATCQDLKCEKLAIKAANFDPSSREITVVINNIQPVAFEEKATLYHISGDNPEAENSLENPQNVIVKQEEISVSGHQNAKGFEFKTTLPSWSASVILLTRKPQPTQMITIS